ncbi:MAG: HDOD domain-containing protein [Methylobacter sp.]
MSLLTSFLKDKKNAPLTRSIDAIVGDDVSIEVLKGLFPIRNYDSEKLSAFASGLKSEIFPEKTALFYAGERTDSALYLLDGTISLSDEQGKTYEIASGTGKAKFPLSSGSKHTTTAISKTRVSVLRVSQKIMSSKYAPLSEQSKLVIPGELAKNKLLNSFAHYYLNEELEIPSLPGIAVKLQHAMQQDIGIADAVKIIQLDPVISAKLIGLANSPLYVSTTPAKSCLEAVNRIGLNAARNLVIGLSLGRIFKSNSQLVNKCADKIWKQSLHIATLSHVLAATTKQYNPQEALLAGLVCDIGAVPFLSFAAKLPKDYCSETDIGLALPCVKGPVGYKILLDWGFSDDFLKVPLYSDDWYQNHGEELNLTDIVVLSRLHSKIGQGASELPTITSIPAASKLKNFALSPEHSLNLLYEAKQQINDAMKALDN